MIKYIESKQNNKIKHAYSLRESKFRRENKEFLAEGKKAIELALHAKSVKEIFTLKELKDIPLNITQYIVKKDVLDKIAISGSPEGIVFISQIIDRKPKILNKVVYLDRVSDPGNVGTIMRTALAFNYDALILSDGCCDPYNEKVVSASKGAIFQLPILHGELNAFRNGKTVIVSALTDKAVDLDELKNDDPFILVLGNEASGVKQEIIDSADIVTKIQISNIDSLNVAIAAGIFMNKLR